MAESVDPVVIAIVLIYLIAVVVIGYYSRIRMKSAMDYYVAGRRIGSVVNGLALNQLISARLRCSVCQLSYSFWDIHSGGR